MAVSTRDGGPKRCQTSTCHRKDRAKVVLNAAGWLAVRYQPPTSGAASRLPPNKLAEVPEVLEGVGAAIDAMGAASRCPTPRWRSLRCEPTPPDRFYESRVGSRNVGCKTAWLALGEEDT
jgi:hypothetical protein